MIKRRAAASTCQRHREETVPRYATGVIWFRSDLRLAHHAALDRAVRDCERLVCLYVLDQTPELRPLGGAANWWLAGSLRALAASLRERNHELVLRRGDPRAILPEIVREIEAQAVFWNASADPAAAAIEYGVSNELRRAGSEPVVSPTSLLHNPMTLRNSSGQAMQRFTPFWRALQSRVSNPPLVPTPTGLPPPVRLRGDELGSWNLEPTKPDWAGGLRRAWTAGEAQGLTRIEAFIEDGLADYPTRRDVLDGTTSSRLSPHLRFGEIAPAQVWHAVMHARDANTLSAGAADKFLAELAWREFAYHTLARRPDLATDNLQATFDAFPWRDDERGLRAWQSGRTGYPIVDAAMRDLWATGFMPNRARMIVSSFLTKHLQIDWRRGEEWFWDTLVDADPANNPFSWQWVAGSGADAAPFFRIFNPILQGQKFDAEGAYIRRHVPELAQLSPEHIHEPWRAPPNALAEAGVTLGATYPSPIVEHEHARARALAAYRSIRR